MLLSSSTASRNSKDELVGASDVYLLGSKYSVPTSKTSSNRR